MNQTNPARYRKPGWFTQHVFNKAVALLTRAGISVWGSRGLEVAGRTSGEPRQVPVNLLSRDDNQYLVSARGTGQWVRNVRAAGGRLDLLLGRISEITISFLRAQVAHGARAVQGFAVEQGGGDEHAHAASSARAARRQ